VIGSRLIRRELSKFGWVLVEKPRLTGKAKSKKKKKKKRQLERKEIQDKQYNDEREKEKKS
jgi:hypothetical protein